MRRLLPALVLLALAVDGPAGSQGAPAPPPAPTAAPAELRGPLPLPDEDAPQYGERIDVLLASIAVRVVSATGEPVPGLAARDFRLRAGKREIPVVAVEWVGSPAAGDIAALEEQALSDEPAPPPRGQLVLFFVQADFAPSRLTGHLRMLPRAQKFLDTLGPLDRSAIVSYDSHLKLRADFTADRETLDEALAAAIRRGDEPLFRTSKAREPSLLLHRDAKAWRAAASPERALELAARALLPLDGPKAVVYLGWGLGNLTPIGVRMPPEYGDALRALEAAHASVFVLDVTDADYHSLEVGLEHVAAATGGTYAKTHQHPDAAVERLAGTISGYYVLYYAPEAREERRPLRVELADGVRGEVLPAPYGG